MNACAHRSPRNFIAAAFAIVTASGLVLTACEGNVPPPPSENGARTYGRVGDFINGFGVADLSVCEWVDGEATDLCTTTDDAGEFILDGFEENQDGILLFDKPPYFPLLGHWNSARQDFGWDVPLPDEGVIELNTNLATDGGEVERGMGQIFFSARIELGPGQPGRAGIFAEAAPGSEALGETVYGNAAGLPDLEQEGTSGIGSAVWSNVPPGDYEILVTGDCEPYFSHDPVGEDLNLYPVTVHANSLSTLTIACEEP